MLQNRFKSILCQEDAYLLELVRYIHLNPMISRVVQGLDELDLYPYSGYSVLMGKKKVEWQDTRWVPGLFEERLTAAGSFVGKGFGQGRRQGLTGVGLLRSAAGWEGVKALRRSKVYPRNDERIPGNGDFVERVLASAQEAVEKRCALRSAGFDLEKVVSRVSEVLGVRPEEVWAEGKYRRLVEARSLLCYWAVRELGISLASLSRMLRIPVPSVSDPVARGQRIAEERHLLLTQA